MTARCRPRMSAAIDRKFEQTLAALINSGEPADHSGRPQGRRKGVAARHARRPHRADAASARARLGAHQREHHHRLFRGADRAGLARRSARAGSCCSTCSTCTSSSTSIWATNCCGRRRCRRIIDGDASIPIAQFGKSNIGRMKTVYREGLGVRYGRMMQAISGVHFNYSFPEQHVGSVGGRWCSRATAARISSRSATSTCCATTAAMAGSCCICSACRRWCATRFLRGRNVHAAAPLEGHLVRAVRHQPAHERSRLPQSQPGRAVGLGQQPRRVRARPVARHQHAARALREVRREGRRRVPPAQRQHPADRERVLQLHPAEARGALRRTAHQGAAPRRRRIRRGARARRQRLRSGGRQPEQAALPRGFPRAVPHEGFAAHRRRRTGRCWTPIT